MYTDIAKTDYVDSWLNKTPYFALPSTAQLLSHGGDSRVSVNADGVNKYGCTAYPDTELLAFGSSTASVISPHAFTAADALRNKLVIALKNEAPELVYSHELHRIRHEFFSLCGLNSIKNLQMIFGASGTDLHLICAQLAHSNKSKPTLVIMPDSSETGSGVEAALNFRHFAQQSALGASTNEGSKIQGGKALQVVSMAMRHADGSLRAESAVDAEVESLVQQAVQAGQKVLLILIDSSKTGLISPSIACALRLKKLYPDSLDVLVDACQFRISNQTLRAYLEQQFMLIVTGSKFITGPIFSAALLLPQPVAKRLLRHPLPQGIADYSTRAEWPEKCIAARQLHDQANFGLLLRWEAALEEMRQFKALSEQQIVQITKRFASAISTRLKDSPYIALMPNRPLDRSALLPKNAQHKIKSWDNSPTIFSLLLHRTDDNSVPSPLTHAETLDLYKNLNPPLASIAREKSGAKLANTRCQLGQPVICGKFNGNTISALRLCLSTRLIVAASLNNGDNIEWLIQQAFSVIDTIEALLAGSKRNYSANTRAKPLQP